MFAPADVAQSEAFCAFDAEANVVVAWAIFFGGAGPDIVDADAAEAVFVFEDVGADAVFVWELGARVGTEAAEDAFGIAEPVAHGVEVMDGHDAEGDPAEVGLPGHPVRDGAHVDGGEDGFAEMILVEERFGGADGLVEAHVLIYGENDAGAFAGFDGLEGFGVIHAEGFLGEDAADGSAFAGGED